MRLLGQELFTDVTIASEGRRIKCHKVGGGGVFSAVASILLGNHTPYPLFLIEIELRGLGVLGKLVSKNDRIAPHG